MQPWGLVWGPFRGLSRKFHTRGGSVETSILDDAIDANENHNNTKLPRLLPRFPGPLARRQPRVHGPLH